VTFTDISIDPAQFWDKRLRCHWCGTDAVLLVSRTSLLTGNRYTDYACHRCAEKWRAA